jgi:beta-xylosidase
LARPKFEGCPVLEAVMLWNEPTSLFHGDLDVDPELPLFSRMVRDASRAIRAVTRELPIVLGGISPIDPGRLKLVESRGVLNDVDAVAVHGFPLDWHPWAIDEWPRRLHEVSAVARLPVWISEAGASSFGAEEVQEFGLRRTAALVVNRAPRVHWYSLFDLPRAWSPTTRHHGAHGSAYDRHFHMGLIREDGTPKRALDAFSEFAPDLGICQWFHFDDPRLEDATRWLSRLGVRFVRTGLSWADGLRPAADEWFDRQMRALDQFSVTATFCLTPDSFGPNPQYASPPKTPSEFAEFCARLVRRYRP